MLGGGKPKIMTGSRSRYALDTSILIDLHNGNLIEAFFSLPYQFLTPDVIVEELGTPDGKSLLRLGLRQVELSARQVLDVMALRATERSVSVNDLFAYVLARDEKITLLTGDWRLRRLAERRLSTVHGVLWVLDEMVRLGVIQPDTASTGLTRMLAFGARLPKDECERRLRIWHSM